MTTIVITGAAGGIGRALCPMLDADLLLIDREGSGVEALAAELGATAVVGSPLSLSDCQEALSAAPDQIDGFVHLAGTFEPDPVLAEDPTIFPRTMQNNLENAYAFATALQPRLPKDGSGRVVFVASLAFRQGSADHTAYTVAKGGLVGLTRSLARRFAPGATVNALAPGIIETPMPAHIIAERGERLKRLSTLGRFGRPEEVASVIRFLLSAESSYITGQCINVDGGSWMS